MSPVQPSAMKVEKGGEERRRRREEEILHSANYFNSMKSSKKVCKTKSFKCIYVAFLHVYEIKSVEHFYNEKTYRL